jgi:hypothetical protein
VRSEALDQLRTDPVALRDPKVKAALIDQLDRESQEPMYDEEEDYASYLDWLADTVAKVVDWNNPRQVCVLANGAMPAVHTDGTIFTVDSNYSAGSERQRNEKT